MKISSIIAIIMFAFIFQPLEASAANFKQAAAYFKQGNFRQAVSGLEECKKQYPNSTLIRYYLAMSYQQVGDLASAKEEYQWVAINGDEGYKARAKAGYAQLIRHNLRRPTSPPPTTDEKSEESKPKVPKKKVKTIMEFYTDT